ncbi:pullulanase [Alkalibacterium sp. AK22]|uniref:pullulanase n=1 Tax=Alkalibacterium sp. AK22 TaxID=1229520 RepID=UPI0012DBE73E|nr:pullulanase [Alkalibacterium sp. AK22]
MYTINNETSRTMVRQTEGDDLITAHEKNRTKMLASAKLLSVTELAIYFENKKSADVLALDTVMVKDESGQSCPVESIDRQKDKGSVVLKGQFSVEAAPYTVSLDEESIPVLIGWKIKDQLYNYKDVLGATLQLDGTAELTVWSPSADRVTAVLYDKTDPEQKLGEGIAMNRKQQGAWSVRLNEENTGLEDLTGYFYHFEIERAGKTVLALDPYARSLAVWDSSRPEHRVAKAAIVDPKRIGPEMGYAEIAGFTKREDAVIYEVHVRDFTSDPSIKEELAEPFGTFRAFTEKLDYIKELGATHIQLLPVMSFYHINEAKKDERLLHYASNDVNYNWGYDPQSYFALTGMYSTDPTDPEKRIEEFKELVQAIHERGMGVILDVVYNHTAQTHIFEDLEPEYYHFMDRKGHPRESFGGGRIGTTHAMSRRLLVDSILHWVDTYKVDGFRFDMMGDHDAQTIQEAYDQAAALNPNLLMIGEGWRTYVGDEGEEDITPADQDWMAYTSAVGSFSDDFRNELKSGFMNEGEPSFLTGGPRAINRLFDNLTACPHNFKATDPGDVVPYIEAHDNLTLHDVIAKAIGKDPDAHQEEIHKRIRLGNVLTLTAQGTVFIHAGQEYGRTKQFRDDAFTEAVPEEQVPDRSIFVTDSQGKPFNYPYFIHDSVYATDAVNRFDWSKALDNAAYPLHTETQKYTQGLIQLRRKTDAFRKGSLEEIRQSVSLIEAPEIAEEDLVIAFQAVDSSGDRYAVLVNADETERVLTTDTDFSKAQVIVDAEKAGTETIRCPSGLAIDKQTVTLKPLSAAVLLMKKS